MEKKIIILITVITLLILGAGLFLVTKTNPQITPANNVNLQDLVGDARHAKGNSSAKVTLVEVADFQCPACADAYPYVKTILDQHKDDVYYVYRHFPLSQHKNAFISAEAAEAAGEQNKFWEMFGLLFEKQKDWQDLSKPTDKFVQYAKDLGLDEVKFKKALDERKFKNVVQKDLENAMKIGVFATPAFYINGELFSGDLSQLIKKVEEKLSD